MTPSPIRRTLNRGVSWTSAKVLNTSAGSEYTLAASGSKAVIGYTTTSSGAMRARFRRTTDKGTTWSASKPLVGAPTGTFSTRPQFSYRSGVLAVIFKYGAPGASPIWIKESTDFGLTWSSRTRVSVAHFTPSEPEPAGIAVLGSIRLAGYNENREHPERGPLGPPLAVGFAVPSAGAARVLPAAAAAGPAARPCRHV